MISFIKIYFIESRKFLKYEKKKYDVFEALEDADEESQIIFENQNISSSQPEQKEIELKEEVKVTKKETEEKMIIQFEEEKSVEVEDLNNSQASNRKDNIFN